jgi:hypothetical protein
MSVDEYGPVVLSITAKAGRCQCSFVILLSVVFPTGQREVIRIHDHGDPFEAAGVAPTDTYIRSADALVDVVTFASGGGRRRIDRCGPATAGVG